MLCGTDVNGLARKRPAPVTCPAAPAVAVRRQVHAEDNIRDDDVVEVIGVRGREQIEGSSDSDSVTPLPKKPKKPKQPEVIVLLSSDEESEDGEDDEVQEVREPVVQVPVPRFRDFIDELIDIDFERNGRRAQGMVGNLRAAANADVEVVFVDAAPRVAPIAPVAAPLVAADPRLLRPRTAAAILKHATLNPNTVLAKRTDREAFVREMRSNLGIRYGKDPNNHRLVDKVFFASAFNKYSLSKKLSDNAFCGFEDVKPVAGKNIWDVSCKGPEFRAGLCSDEVYEAFEKAQF